MYLKRTNKEGLTFLEWMAAAGLGSIPVVDLDQKYLDAWSAAEDPTEWRALAPHQASKGRKVTGE